MVNSEILNINAKVNVLKDEYTKLENEINYFYWPKDALLRKRRKDYLWLFSISICVLIIAILSVLFEFLKNEYLIGLALGLAVLLLGFTGFITLRYHKKLKLLTAEWDKSLKPVRELKEELETKMYEALQMMIKYIKNDKKLTDEELAKEVGTSYEEVYVYYDNLVNN